MCVYGKGVAGKCPHSTRNMASDVRARLGLKAPAWARLGEAWALKNLGPSRGPKPGPSRSSAWAHSRLSKMKCVNIRSKYVCSHMVVLSRHSLTGHQSLTCNHPPKSVHPTPHHPPVQLLTPHTQHSHQPRLRFLPL